MNATITQEWYDNNLQHLLAATDYIRNVIINEVEDIDIELDEVDPQTQNIQFPITTSLSITPALEQLCITFDLSEFERDVLLMCVAMELDRNFEDLCANAQDNSYLNYPTLSLALAVLPQPLWRILSGDCPLHYWQLVEVSPSETLTKSRLKIDKSILCYLLGEAHLDEQLRDLVKPINIKNKQQIHLQPSHQNLAEQLANLWSVESNNSASPVIQLFGQELTAITNIAAEICSQLGCNLYVTKAHRLPLNANHLTQWQRRWEREAKLSNSVLLLDCYQFSGEDVAVVATLEQLVDNIKSRLIIAGRDRLPLTQYNFITREVLSLSKSEQYAVWEENLGTKAAELNGHIEKLVSHFNLSQVAIESACAEAFNTFKAESKNNFAKVLWHSCRSLARPQLDDLAQHIRSSATWDDLILPEEQSQTLREMVAHVRQRMKVYEKWGFASKGGRGLGISALLAGASGTGKTLSAEVVANELNLDLYRIDLSSVVSKYIGETEKNLRRIFDAAEIGGAVLLFDEADALFGKRTQVKDSHDRHANIEVSYLLQRMEAYQGLVVLTTNLKESIDTAFLRRIRFILNYSFPDVNERTAIWRRIFPPGVPTQDLDYEQLGKLNVSGGNIRNIALNAAFLAADANQPVMMKHIRIAADTEYRKIGKVLTDNEVKNWVL
ncbi:MAG TPA: ATP-binding protein [Nostocaceae cyanobacterium]|nr:ATP-binding protein [Nostocaceae cyanobacterium]